MKRALLISVIMLVALSCIKEEPQNAEADILSCVVLNEDGEPDTGSVRGRIIYTNDQIIISALPTIEISNVAIQVELTHGATIYPDPQIAADYISPREFTVTSQDGEWQKTYTITIDIFDLPTSYDFEDYEYDGSGKYHIFYSHHHSSEGAIKQYIWASGNPGYGISGIAQSAEEYPTISVPDGNGGRMACLRSRSTGAWGAMLNMPLAGGNLFIGNFDSSTAVTKPLESTRFGFPFSKRPIKFRGEYCYQPGKIFTAGVDENRLPQEINYADTCEIYAVLYEVDGLEAKSLDGGNALTSKNIVSIARVTDINLSDPSATPVLEGFEIDFDYGTTSKVYWPDFVVRDSSSDNNGILRPFDSQKAESYGYNLAIVLSSSRYAGYFAGAENSVLYIDNIEIICE